MQNNEHMKDFVMELLKNNLPVHLCYHNVAHTMYVADKVIEIAQHENCSTKEIELLFAAACWHDTGFINVYNGHEEESCIIARQYLPLYQFTNDDINIICKIIMATKQLQTPQNKLEEIIADADLEYLGTQNANTFAHNLFRELKYLNPLLEEKEWNKLQIYFLEKHQYHTAYCKKNKEPLKEAYLQYLISTA
jgi:predicted metal-dependent HD superfamily phosphohydrolase